MPTLLLQNSPLPSILHSNMHIWYNVVYKTMNDTNDIYCCNLI